MKMLKIIGNVALGSITVIVFVGMILAFLLACAAAETEIYLG